MNPLQSKDKLSQAPTISKVLSDGRLVELVFDAKKGRTHLAVGIGAEIAVADEVAIPGAPVLVPYSAGNNLIKHQVVCFAENPESPGSVTELVSDIGAYIDRYVDVEPAFRLLASYFILLTWVYDAFNELPYLRFRGNYGSGKSRALYVVGSLCQKAFFASGASTVSPVFHILDAFRGTLVIDEADFRFSDEMAEMTKILNNGNVRGFPVLRSQLTAKKEFEPRAFNVFGPKLIAMRRSFEDRALESRFFTADMGKRTLREDIPINLPEEQRARAVELRNRLLGYRFAWRSHLKVDDTLVDVALSPRLNQILVPLLSVVEDLEARALVKQVVVAQEGQSVSEPSVSPEQLLASLLEASFAEGRRSVPVGELTEKLQSVFHEDGGRPITSRFVGELLRGKLGISTYKSHGVYVVHAPRQ